MVTDTTAAARFDRLEGVSLVVVGGVGIVGATTLLAAAVGVLHLWVWLPVSLTLTGGLAAVLLRRTAPGHGRSGWWWLLPIVVLALFLTLPGFRYATGDKDPGVYVMHAWNMSHTDRKSVV